MDLPELPPRILVLDDDAAPRARVAGVLSEQGYLVTEASTPDEALVELAQHDFTIVLADYSLAFASHPSVVGEVERSPAMTVELILTAPRGTISTIDVLRAGAQDHLEKPYVPEVVRAIVGRRVERVALARTMRETVEELDEGNARLSAAAAELRRRVDEATTELRRKVRALDEANLRLKEVNREREEFISVVAHELGNPLTAVAGYVELIGRPGIPAAAQERARRTVLNETRRMSRLLEDLCEASRVVGGHFRITPVRCDLVEIVRQQVELARASTQRHVVRFEPPAGTLMTRCDADRIAQALANLLGNAVKYSSGGEIAVTLARGGRRARISVTDEGPGIPFERQAAIFDPYVRVATSETPRQTKRSGAGLGLAITKRIVEAHGGRIAVDSAPGRGTTFTVLLPLAAGGRADGGHAQGGHAQGGRAHGGAAPLARAS